MIVETDNPGLVCLAAWLGCTLDCMGCVCVGGGGEQQQQTWSVGCNSKKAGCWYCMAALTFHPQGAAWLGDSLNCTQVDDWLFYEVSSSSGCPLMGFLRVNAPPLPATCGGRFLLTGHLTVVVPHTCPHVTSPPPPPPGESSWMLVWCHAGLWGRGRRGAFWRVGFDLPGSSSSPATAAAVSLKP
jgi:hypothetical protein